MNGLISDQVRPETDNGAFTLEHDLLRLPRLTNRS